MITGNQLLGIVLISIIVAAVRLSRRFKSQNQRLVPRGPLLRLPIVGHLLFLGTQPHKTLFKWSEKFGPMFRIQLGSFEAVVINDGHLIRKAFTSDALSGRPKMPIYDAFGCGGKDIAFSSGLHVQVLRRFFFEKFKDYASNSSESMEQRILTQAGNIISAMSAYGKAAMQVRGFFHISVANSLLDIMTGLKFPPGHPVSEHLKNQIQNGLEVKGVPELLGIFLPKVCEVAPNWSGLQRRLEIGANLATFFAEVVEKHKATFIRGQPRDILDSFLEKSRKSEEGSTFDPQSGHLIPFLMDLLGAGMETTATSMEWIIYYLAKHSDIQAKIQDEINNFVGFGRSPCLQDRISLVFTEAFILETLRMASAQPLAVFHSAVEDYEFNGYFIPKETVVIGNVYAAHHDHLVWGDPHVFRPDRFIEPATGRLRRCDGFIPFSGGKRSCIGEDLARQELFLFTACILQQFQLRSAEELPQAQEFGITIAPLPFKVIINRRI